MLILLFYKYQICLLQLCWICPLGTEESFAFWLNFQPKIIGSPALPIWPMNQSFPARLQNSHVARLISPKNLLCFTNYWLFTFSQIPVKHCQLKSINYQRNTCYYFDQPSWYKKTSLTLFSNFCLVLYLVVLWVKIEAYQALTTHSLRISA